MPSRADAREAGADDKYVEVFAAHAWSVLRAERAANSLPGTAGAELGFVLV